MLQILSDNALTLPISSKQLAQRMNLLRFKPVNHDILYYFLQKLVAQSHISINNINSGSDTGYEVTLVDHSRVNIKIVVVVKRQGNSNIVSIWVIGSIIIQ